jgi:prepilin-type processing-associated H-X9-DG protein
MLVELLVVIGIIALLVAILPPVMARAREDGNFGFADGSVQRIQQSDLHQFYATMATGSKVRAYLPIVN